jgi:membrane protein EpsK
MMTQYVNLISRNISGAVGRFLTIALQRDDAEDANRIFNTAFFSYLVLGLIQIPVFALIICRANILFAIPTELYWDAILLLVCSAASFLVNLVCSVFAVPIYANNRLDISRLIDISRMIVRVAAIIVLFVIWGPALRYVGYVDLVLTTMLCGIQVHIGRQLAPALRLALHYFDLHKVKELVGMGWWLFVSQVGALLFLRTDVWVCNRFVGAEAAGDYAAVLQWPALIREAGGLIGTVIAPMVVIYFARSETENIIRISTLAVRILSLSIAIPISMMCVLSPSLLRIWLGDSYVKLAPLMVVMLCHLVVNVGVTPLFNINEAMNKVRWPGLATLIGGIFSLLLALLFVTCFGWGIVGVATAGAIALTLKNMFFVPIYTARILGQPWHTFFRSCLSGLASLATTTTCGLVVVRCLSPTSWTHLSLLVVTMGVVGVTFTWFGLPKRDRLLIVDLVPARLRSLVAGVLEI